MREYPKPSDEPWHPSETEDYNNAKDDEERRRMLLIFGYDEIHRPEKDRLFDPPVPKAKEPEPLDRIESELKAQTDQIRKYHAVQESDQDAQRKQDTANRRKSFRDGILVGIISSTIAGLILYYWPDIVAFFSGLIS